MDRIANESANIHTETRIIGVELEARLPNGMSEELEIFPCRHTVPWNYNWPTKIRVTLHTSHGDRSALIDLTNGFVR